LPLLRRGKRVTLFRYTRFRAPFGPRFMPPVVALCGALWRLFTISLT
jgi:hypothetical protein